MKESWQKMNCTKIHLTATEDFDIFPKINKPQPSSCYLTTTCIMITILLIGITAISYIFWKINFNKDSQPPLVLSNEEFKILMLSIVDEDFNRLFSEDGNNQTSFFGELQVLDDDYHILWSKDLDDINLRNLDKKIVSFDQKSKSKKESISVEDDYSWEEYDDDNDLTIPSTISSSQSRGKRSNYVTSPPSSKPKKYVVSHQARFVNCERLKPIPRGKYLVSPSLSALHTCYKNGVYLNELELGMTRNQGGEFRYDLTNLYIACEDVFNEDVEVLTDDLLRDYERCKWSKALGSRQQAFIEHRFADRLGYPGQVQVPGQLQMSSTTSTTTSLPVLTRLDPRSFVDCNHVETELFEDYFESPSYEALQRCQKYGVTASQLEQGIEKNPKFNEIYFDVSNLYLPCSYVFDEQLLYMTKMLKEDYRRCKKVGALNEKAQQFIEKKFHEALDEDLSATEKSSGGSTTSTEDPSSSYSSEDDYDSSYSSVMETSTKSPSHRYAFANCKHVEGGVYMICIKVIKVY